MKRLIQHTKSLKRSFLLILVMASTHLVSGCSDSDDNNSMSKQAVTISGSAIKGTLNSAKVEAISAADMSVLGTTQTNNEGEYTLEFEKNADQDSGLILIKVSADEDTEMICDADKCGSVNNGDTVTASDLSGLELMTTLTLDKSTNSTVEVTGLPVNSLTTAATEVITNSLGGSVLSTLTGPDLSKLQQDASEVVLSSLGVSDRSLDIFSSKIPDATKIEAGLSASFSNQQKNTATQLSILNAAFAGTDDGLVNELSDYLNALKGALSSGDFNSNFSTTIQDIQAAYTEAYDILNGAGGIPSSVTIADFTSITWPSNINFENGGIVIDIKDPNTGGDGTGSWTLTITGKATVNGIQIDIPEVKVQNVAAVPSSANTADIESAFKQQTEVGGITVQNVSFNITEETSTKVVIEYSATITASGITQTQNLIYTYTR
ncbi:hypothetical protein [Catenovulum maritimum]|uniref:Lipoprotein n=1 Tax=Catenovulum maritimum TaxID=1513271 RepID=A0A0J8GNC0_9ALTE|nr:hypothetical protein [Catenovulum maritimum]KMT64305.1 hypothetical protein XM47_15015 [Catenovulum maritimum]